jgi:ATP phosphoribosyltransferase
LDLGIAGQDVVKENGVNVYEIMALGFGRCRLMVAVLKTRVSTEKRFDLNSLRGKAIATTYPVITKDFFDQRQIPITPIQAEGGVEALAVMGWTDAIVDVVETGKSLVENYLVPVDTVFESEAELIANPNFLLQKGKQRILSNLLRQINRAIKL